MYCIFLRFEGEFGDLFEHYCQFGMLRDVVNGEGEVDFGGAEIADELVLQHEEETLVGGESSLGLFVDQAEVDCLAIVELSFVKL